MDVAQSGERLRLERDIQVAMRAGLLAQQRVNRYNGRRPGATSFAPATVRARGPAHLCGVLRMLAPYE